jgi:hypothetical protein
MRKPNVNEQLEKRGRPGRGGQSRKKKDWKTILVTLLDSRKHPSRLKCRPSVFSTIQIWKGHQMKYHPLQRLHTNHDLFSLPSRLVHPIFQHLSRLVVHANYLLKADLLDLFRQLRVISPNPYRSHHHLRSQYSTEGQVLIVPHPVLVRNLVLKPILKYRHHSQWVPHRSRSTSIKIRTSDWVLDLWVWQCRLPKPTEEDPSIQP